MGSGAPQSVVEPLDTDARLSGGFGSGPGPEYLVGDMTSAEFASGSIDVVTAFYSLIHVPREEHPAMLAAIGDSAAPKRHADRDDGCRRCTELGRGLARCADELEPLGRGDQRTPDARSRF